MDPEPIRLTQFSHGAGCGCKIAPAVLEQILGQTTPKSVFPELLVGNGSRDDAAVYDMGDGKALISTTDFFTPIVDDPYLFGKIAAANAISDVYAMGGSPILALAILGWPVDTIPADIAGKVLSGARDICQQAGIPLAGGHSIDTREPVFGLAVNGIADIGCIKQNNTAKAGDLLYLTKPIGTGILSTAQKRGLLQEDHTEAWFRQLTTLNSVGQLLGKFPAVHAMTDVTGFGLLGHLVEMANGSGLGAILHYHAIPVLDSARTYLSQRIVPDATYRNWNAYQSLTAFDKGVNVMEAFTLLPDPQTNGGLLIAVDPVEREAVETVLSEAGLQEHTTPIGYLEARGEKVIRVMT